MKRNRYAPRSAPPPRAASSSGGIASFFNVNYASVALLGVIFVIGIGVGIAFSSTATFNPENVASREVIDRSAPNPELCVQYGASAIVTDMRLFVTLNPFSVFVTQPHMEPGCVLRRNNWSILERQNLVSNEQVSDCKRRMNTFAYTGPLEGSPEIKCVYQNDSAGNLFFKDSGAASANGVFTPQPENDNF